MAGQAVLVFLRYQRPLDREYFADLEYDHCCVSDCHLLDDNLSYAFLSSLQW